MADNVEANAGSGGALFATDDIDGVQHPRTKIVIGADGVSDGDVSASNPLPVVGEVEVTAAALPTGAATAAKQDTGNTALASIDGKITAVNTGAVVVASSALPTGAATSAKQDTLIGHVDGIETLLAGGLPAALGAQGALTVEGVASGTAIPVTASNVTGNIAHGTGDSGNPVKVGAVARTTAFPTAESAADRVDLMADAYGRLMVANVPHGLLLTGQLARTDNNGADIIAAQGSGFVIVVTAVIVTNAHASVGTKVSIRDGTTVKLRQYAHHSGGGFVIGNGHAELFRSSDNAAITGICGTTGADVEITVIGYKAPA